MLWKSSSTGPTSRAWTTAVLSSTDVTTAGESSPTSAMPTFESDIVTHFVDTHPITGWHQAWRRQVVGHLQHRDARRLGEIDDRKSGFVPACSIPVTGSQSAKILQVADMADAVQPHQGNSPYSTLRMISRTRRRPSNVSQRSMGRSPPQGGQRGAEPVLCAFKAAECVRGGGEKAQRVQKPLGSSRAEGLSTVETTQMTGGRSQKTNEEIAMTDRVDRLLDDLPRQSRSHCPDVGRLIDESGGRNADALDSRDSSRMFHGEYLSVSGCHERYHRTEWAGSLLEVSSLAIGERGAPDGRLEGIVIYCQRNRRRI